MLLEKTYYIAAIGKACNGDLDYCWRLLNECKKAKVDAVRFHHYFLQESVHSSMFNEIKEERTWSFELKLPFSNEVLFTEESYRAILQWCNELQIDFIATPWDIKSLELFKRVGVQNYKINSMNAMNVPLVERVCENSSKLYISTGGLSENHVKELCSRIDTKIKKNLVLLHSVNVYPTPENIINLRAMNCLTKYAGKVGYSSNDITDASILGACALGAEVIEKHVHLEGETKELHEASIGINKYGQLIKDANKIKRVLGREIKHESRGEMINQEILSKSIVLKDDVKKGSILDHTNLTLKLPSKAINAKQWNNVIGNIATSDLKKGDYLLTNNIEYKDDSKKILRKFTNNDRTYIPGKVGVVVRLKDIEDMVRNRDVDYIELHYAASDLKKSQICKDYDLDLVVHFPEYADGKMLDLCSYDESLRQFSIDVVNDVMEKTREIKRHFKRCKGDVKFVLHPGAMTFPKLLDNPSKQYELFADSLRQLNSKGLEVLIENMLSFAWFLDGGWAPNQGLNNSFMDATDMYDFCVAHNYGMCLDLCHAKLYTNHTGKSFLEYMKKVKPIVRHLHFSDSMGIDSEGLQIGEGDINWRDVCEVFNDHKYGWTPEIWNGHHDNGQKFYEAHSRLNNEFYKYRNSL